MKKLIILAMSGFLTYAVLDGSWDWGWDGFGLMLLAGNCAGYLYDEQQKGLS